MAFTPSTDQTGNVVTPDFSVVPGFTPPAVDAAAPAGSPDVTPTDAVSTDTVGLDSIKKDAVQELRPLVDKLDLPPEEKFNTLLLIIRSTDDQSLLGAAHDAARQIPDDTKRAQALLDIIKEIDFFGQSSVNNK
jgi:hypothetical protein